MNLNEWDFSYDISSPCIDAGNPSQTDPDNSIRDIGARWYGDYYEQPGDCNLDSIQNILDVVFMINECILGDFNDCSCGDINQDNIVNILDVVMIINIILDI